MRPVVVVGAGPAGISAAIHLQRAGLEPVLLEANAPGGLLRQSRLIENYPGFPGGIAANALIDLFLEHLQSVGGSVTKASVDRVSRCDDGTYVVSALFEAYRSRAVIVATGTRAKRIEVKGLRAVEGSRAFYDILELLATARSRDKIVVYGGGDTAFDMGINLSQRGHKVDILCRSKARCLPLLRARADEEGITVVEGRSIKKVRSADMLKLELEGSETVEADRLLIACGRGPRLDILDHSLVTSTKSGDRTAVNVPGLHLAGDVVADRRRQVGIAVGSGLTAAMLTERYLKGMSV